MGILRKNRSFLQICKSFNFSCGKARNAIAFYKKHGTWKIFRVRSPENLFAGR